MRGRTRAAVLFSGAGIGAVLVVGALAGVAAAVSGGGYNPDQQDCNWNSDNWADPGTQAGCHNLAVNVESGGQTGGNPSTGNARYFEYGGNELPNTTEPATPTVLGIGYPGQQNSQHGGCIAFDTNGTGGGTGTGCGTGSGGLGFSTTYDYYDLVQPGYSYQAVPFVDPFSVIGGNPQVGTMQAPVPDPTATKVNGGAPVSQPGVDQNPSGATGQGSVLNTFMTEGLIVYFGMDDNNDAGEHDGVSGAEGPCPIDPTLNCKSAGVVNGPSDGGGMVLSLEPQWLLGGSPSAPTATHPQGLLNYSEGECADGICGAFTTQQQTVYQGCGATNPQNNGAYDQCTTPTTNDDVYKDDTPSSQTEPFNCSSGDASSESCGGSGLDQYRQGTPRNMYAEPGVQTYEDPDPQRSPAAPFVTPGLYVGTCGVYVDDSGGSAPGVVSTLTGGNMSAPAGQYVVGPTDASC